MFLIYYMQIHIVYVGLFKSMQKTYNETLSAICKR